MKVTNSQSRIRELMETYSMSVTEFSNRTGVQKSAISNYIHGNREPRQEQIAKMASGLGVNPAWLMGYDVPMAEAGERKDLTPEEWKIIVLYRGSDLELRGMVKRLLGYTEGIENLEKKGPSGSCGQPEGK